MAGELFHSGKLCVAPVVASGLDVEFGETRFDHSSGFSLSSCPLVVVAEVSIGLDA